MMNLLIPKNLRLCNEFLQGGDKLYPLNSIRKTEYKVLLVSVGNMIEGGVDIWVNNFIDLVCALLYQTKKVIDY